MTPGMVMFEIVMMTLVGIIIGAWYGWETSQELKQENEYLKSQICKRPHVGDINTIEDSLIAKYGNIAPSKTDKAYAENKQILGI